MPTFNIANTGAMVMKMPKNSLPTSKIGPQSKSLALRISCAVVFKDKMPMTMKSTSRTMFCKVTGVPKMSNSTPDFQMPDINTAAMMPSSHTKLSLPEMLILLSGVGSIRLRSVSLRQ